MSGGKLKTTAGDLVDDFETQQEHDVIASGCNLDTLTGDVGELELDDDELLGLGNDFNILEYADPELDKGLVGEGEKSNILDEHLDLDDKDEELEDDVIKEQDNAQDKELMGGHLHHEKKEPMPENQKCADDNKPIKSELQESFMNFKKDNQPNIAFESSFKSQDSGPEKSSSICPVDELITVKDEPKTVFSSCSMAADIDIKPEKGIADSCSLQKKHSLSFNQEPRNISSQHSELQSQILPPPSYRMVTTLKQSTSAQPSTLSPQNKNLFPLHMNINVRHDIPLPQQGVISLPVQSNKPLLLQEQPLLLEDLVEQEKREQRRQTQEGLISPDTLLSDIDFERLKDDVFSGPPDDSIGGPGSLLGSHDHPMQASVSPTVCVSSASLSHSFGPPPYSLLWQNPDAKVSLAPRPLQIMQGVKTKAPVSAVIGALGSMPGSPLAQKAPGVPGTLANHPFCQNLPSNGGQSPDVDPADQEKLKMMNYEKQLLQQQAVLGSQQKFYETEVIKLRKVKKALNAKQRQLRKNGSELSDNDAVELTKVSQEQAALQKQLDQVRKQTRQNTIAIQDFRLKQQKRLQLQQQQQPQSVPQSPLHTSISSVQSSPQNSRSPLQFSHTAPQSPMMPASPVVSSPPIRIQHSPSPLTHQSPVTLSSPTIHQPSSHIHTQLFQQQIPLHLQVAKTEGKGWSSPVKISQKGNENLQLGERIMKKEHIEKSITTPPFSIANTPAQSPLPEGLQDCKKEPASDVPLKRFQEEIVTSSPTTENIEKPNVLHASVSSDIAPQSDQKTDTDTTADPTSSRNILSQSLPSSVTNTLKFTLRQTGMPTVCLQSVDAGSIDDPSQVSTKEIQHGQDSNSNISTSESSLTVKDDLILNIKREIIDEIPTSTGSVEICPSKVKVELMSINEENAESRKKDDANEESSDDELERLSKANLTEGDQGEQNVLLKQLLQNCPSAETSRKADKFIELRKDDTTKDSGKIDVPFDINESPTDKSADPKLKKKTYLDIRRAQLDKEPTPPPNDSKVKIIKRKRPKKKKIDGKPEGPLPKKKCRRNSSKAEEGYETYVEALMTKLTNLPPLRILEPNIKPNYNALSIFGSGDLNVNDNQLQGCYGSATLQNQNDIYSYHPYAKAHPPSSASLPPSSPPYRGFYNQEFSPVTKALERNEMSLALMPVARGDTRRVSRDAGSPDTIISSSSPETCLFEPLCKWPELIFVDHPLPSTDRKKSYSPVIPLVYPVPIRIVPRCRSDTIMSSDLDDDRDKENIPQCDDKSLIGLTKTKMTGVGGFSMPLKDSGNVAVTLTLSSAAAEDICGVLSSLADLLKIPIPATYDIVERTATPPSQKLGLYNESKDPEVNIHTLMNGKPRFCRHCDIVVLSAGIRKKTSDLACISREDQDDGEVIFCSTNCYMQFALTHQSTALLEEKEAATIVDHLGEDANSTDKDTTNPNAEDDLGNLIMGEKDILSSQEDSNLDTTKPGTIMSLEHFKGSVSRLMDAHDSKDLCGSPNNFSICDKNALAKLDMETELMEPVYRKWRSIKYKFWSHDSSIMGKHKHKEDVIEKPTRSFYHTIKPSQMPKDERKCIFCHGTGDGDTNGSARLLNVDVNKWVHLNCALWSGEVYETVNGALMNVETAFKRSVHLICCHCHKQGASVKCFKSRCQNIYHFPCARKEQCSFYKDKTVLCPQHGNRGNPENKLDSVAVFRRVYINRDEHKQIASMIQGDQYVMRVGSLIFLNIGQLLPQQMQAFHTSNCIYPVGYRIIRMYWSMRKLGRRSQYMCTINEISGKPEFCIQVKEVDQKDVILKDKSAKGVWQKVIYPIEKMRKQAKTIKIFPDFISGDDLFGLTEPAVLRIIESLPGVDTLSDYNFRYGRSPFLELPLAINPTGCARSEPKLRTHVKRPHTLHTSNSSRTTFHSSPFAGMEVSSPYIKQFVHSKSSQYRKMKTEWRNNVYLARSRIQGLGLYAARDLEKHTMVIEYIGQLIRNEIAERNEAIYDAQNRGVYMFRLDENRVIDATLSGGLARYMNHSCYPNCVAEVVQIDRENKILIITNRRVTRGEELSYDYKFEVEDDQHKISCLCGASNCRKWMN